MEYLFTIRQYKDCWPKNCAGGYDREFIKFII